ncbi:caspase domain-containing protein [Crepidotus variabilis]|uniref:Caspase domain-containing protein n=1 Tax=Crepidotus variabilis TaxID=179855 RepID=A0A9P6JM20_9AGAR|nr:caspase domain-containing protein [Crepidotus variabilis]
MPPPILALIIGINEYVSDEYDDLHGAVADANAFEAYLKEHLDVPSSNITSLRNLEASRSGIIVGFERLRDNPKYAKGECAIVIFYAGHGAQVDKPEGWEEWSTASGKIEELCPSDIGVPTTIVIKGEEYQDVLPGIPDRTISTMLNHISDIKGNNITLILDCCSSGGINRSATSLDPKEYIPRRIRHPPPINPSLDEKIWSKASPSRGGRAAVGFAGQYQASHVLLAACGRDQFAYETKTGQRGMFTTTLMKVLESENIHSLTYTSLMHKLRMPAQQTPHCEGQGVSWRLFNNSDIGADETLILTKREKEGPIVMHAGEAQGVTYGSLYSIHATNLIDNGASPNPPLGFLSVKAVEAFSSTIDFEGAKFSVPRLCYAKLVQAAVQKLAIHSDNKEWLNTIFPSTTLERLHVTIVDEVESCNLELTFSNGHVFFDRRDSIVAPLLGTRMRHTVQGNDTRKIQDVVRCFRHFHYHVTRSGPNEFRNIWMELKELKQELSDDFSRIFTPFGPNLIESNPTRIVVNEEANLGMTIFNQTDVSLYPYLFYFDPSDLSIFEWYKSPIGAGLGKFTMQVDAPLPAKSKLSLGYGDGGVMPWQFVIPEGETKDVGFFKLFLATRPTYFESIGQESPFEVDEEDLSEVKTRAGKVNPLEPPTEVTWGAQLVTILQVKDPNTPN